LKRVSDSISPIAGPVAPHAGAWIETIMGLSTTILVLVAPHAGAWIETAYAIKLLIIILVAPHAGAWIETHDYLLMGKRMRCRAPRGRVD